ncbi:hypothetical protein [Mycobacterium sp. HUMS_1102779]|uniref:hypothetical protein n=1 Tax=Mycobacterium sp. HUMS_1102779 TaxID=3383487 RepID=UPI00389A5360
MSASRSGSGGGFGGFVAVLLLIAVIIKLIWWILATILLVGLFFLVRAVVRWYGERAAARARGRQELAARADQQHNWVLRGDDRGIYGPAGAALMHDLFPARRQLRRPP